MPLICCSMWSQHSVEAEGFLLNKQESINKTIFLCIVIFNLILSHFSVAFPLVLQYNLWHWNNSCPRKGHSVKVYLSLKKSNRALFMNWRVHFTTLSIRKMLVLLYLLLLLQPPNPQRTTSKGGANLAFSFMLQKASYLFKSLLLLCLWHYGNNKPDSVW